MGLPPSQAGEKDRKIAWFIYVLLVCGWLAYSIYFIVQQVGERDSPPIQVDIKRIKYVQPKFSLCSFNPTILFTSSSCTAVFGKANKNCSAKFEILPYEAADPSKLDSTAIEGLDPSDGGAGIVFLPPDDTGSFFENTTGTNDTENFIVKHQLQSSQRFNLQAASANATQVFCMTFNGDRKTVLRPRTDSLRFKTRFDFAYEIPNDVLALSMFVYDKKLEDSEDFIIPFSKRSIVSVKKTTQESFRSDTESFYDTNIVSLDLAPDFSALPNEYAVEVQVKVSDFEVKYVTEVDPVSATLIMGTISGFWNLVGIAFAIFFIPNPKNKDELMFRKFDKKAIKDIAMEQVKDKAGGDDKKDDTAGGDKD